MPLGYESRMAKGRLQRNLSREPAHIRVDEIVANEEQRLVEIPSQGVDEAVAEVELSWMTCTLAESTICFAGDACLLECDGQDGEVDPLHQSIERLREQWVRMAIDNNGGFKERRGGHAPVGRSRQDLKIPIRSRFVVDNCDDRRRIDDHVGSPSSP